MAERKIGLLADMLPHPGETLMELLDTYGMSQLELSQRIGYTPKHINEVCKGKKPITPDMAIRLSAIFNLSSAFWNNLQANYDSEYNELINEQTVTEDELAILKEVPINELISYGYLVNVNSKNKRATVLLLRKFFRVSELTFITNVLDNTVSAYRKADKEINRIKLATWIAMGLSAYRPSPNRLDVERPKKELPYLKKQILEKDINVAISNLTQILDNCGITFKVLHHLKNVPVQGYIRNINDNILLNLTIRNKYSDIFWFTFFHEIGHILSNKDRKTLNMIDYEFSNDFSNEKQADEFASNLLIDKDLYKAFLNQEINASSIRQLAKKAGVSESIVVGRLGHEDPKYFSRYSYMREQYQWGD